MSQASRDPKTDGLEISENAGIRSRKELEKNFLGRILEEDAHVLRVTKSICPECTLEERFDQCKVDAVIYEEDGMVKMMKECPRHGVTVDLYWGDHEMYKRAKRYEDPGIKLLNPFVKKREDQIDCPLECGLCYKHKSHTALGNIVLTNRCDLSCWYCFFYAREGEPVYEPSLQQIKAMLRSLRNEKPVACNAVQFTGGEPALREDVVEITRIAKEEGYEHIQFNTNGLMLSKNPRLVRDLKEAGTNVIYLSFDGVTPETNPKNYWEVPEALNNCRDAGLGVVLVPTIIKGYNDHELGDIIRFAASNIDIVRGVNFQPVSIVGRIPRGTREKMRITIPDVCRKIEEQTEGQIRMEDFYPVPCVCRITDFMEAIKDRMKYRLSAHFACGTATYVFMDGEELIPIPKFMDVEGLFDYLDELTRDIRASRFKAMAKTKSVAKILWNMGKYIDDSRKPKGLNLLRALRSAIGGGSYDALRDFHHSSLFIGMMHFMDPYNYDIDRVERCEIHYAVPDGRIIPFCAFNVIPELYRDRVQREFSVAPEDWEREHGKRLIEDKYQRRLIEDKKREINDFYDKSLGKSLT